MTEENKPDIDLPTLGTGCATSCGVGCLQLLVIMILISMSGVELARLRPESVPPGIKFIGFLLTLGADAIVGFVTARRAPHMKMLHAIILSVVMLLLGIASIAVNPKLSAQNPFSFLALILCMPATILGARWAISTEDDSGPMLDGTNFPPA